MGAVPPNLSLHPETEADTAFLDRLFASVRWEEMSHTGWPDGAKRAFLAQQGHLQRTHYRKAFGTDGARIVRIGTEPIGRLYLHRSPTGIHIADISLLPEWRGKGIGETLLADVLAEADRDGHPVTLQVEPQNPALRLYRRLGFEPAGEAGWRGIMRRLPRDGCANGDKVASARL